MCTGVRFADAAGNLYFGRNLDWCESYGEGVVITPRGASIPTQFLGSLSPEHACVGMGIVVGGVPCYFDCANEAGLAIAELISGMKKPTVSLVLGGGHSIGVPLAVAPMVTMIAPSASMTIHPVRTSGTIIAAPQTYQYFERLQERIVRFVTKNSRIGRDEFLRLMMDTQDLASDVGSVLYGEEAVACGLIQRLGSLSDALDALYALIDEKKK